jgi:hypothetical protein
MGELAAARLILARLFGGLGNQMFQYACARGLAHTLGAELGLDLSASASYGPRPYALDGLSISASIASAEEVRSFMWRAGISRRLPRWLRHYQVYRERSFTYDPAVRALRGNVLLEGYWQSARYFDDVAALVRREFGLKAALEGENAAWAARIRDANAVSVHVRRGDYVSNPQARQLHGLCDLDYYRRAVEAVAQSQTRPQLFVFSDEPAWARENLRLGFPTAVVESAGENSAQVDMHLMSLCRHHVVANSSFSWWGAWLNGRPDKMVVAPRRWFLVDTKDTRDLVPAEWVRI